MGKASTNELGYVATPSLTLYPALRLLYGGGIAAIADDNYVLLNGLLSEVTISSVTYHGQQVEHKAACILTTLCDYRQIFGVVAGNQSSFSVSDYLYNLLRNPLRAIEPDDQRYEKLFDRFEYIATICYSDTFGDSNMLIGRFGKHLRNIQAGNIKEEIAAELQEYGDNWPPLKAGICSGSIDKFRQWQQQLDETIRKGRQL